MTQPKTFWTYFGEWFDIEKYAASTVSILVGLFFFYHQLTRDTLKSDNDLLQIKGIVTNYSFADKQDGTHQYYIWLESYNNTFQIKADFLGYFEKEEFEAQIKRGDSISLIIPKQKVADLNDRNENVYVISIDKRNINYLDKTKTLENENSGFDIYAGISFMIFGIGYYIFKSCRPTNYC